MQRPTSVRSEVISAKLKFVSALLFSSMAAMASAQSPSILDLRISGSPNHDILDTGTGSLLDYDLANDRIDFSVGSTGVYDSPLFCFDFSSPEGVTLNATDANGHMVMDSVRLGSDLGYDLANNVISMSPASSVQCFFKSSNGTFGPFGKVPNASRSSDPELPPCSEVAENVDCRFLVDAFADYPKLELDFQNFFAVIDNEPVSLGDNLSVSAGIELIYDIVLHNSGRAAAEFVAFQEVFPSEAFIAGLYDRGWDCEDNWDDNNSLCPSVSGIGNLRFDGDQLIYLPAGAKLTFKVSGFAHLDSTDSIGQIHLSVGAVNGPGAMVESAVAEDVIEVTAP